MFLTTSTNFILTQNITLFECLFYYSKNIALSSFLVVFRTLFKGYKNIVYNILLTLTFNLTEL